MTTLVEIPNIFKTTDSSFIYDKETDFPVETTLEVSQTERRFTHRCTASLYDRSQTRLGIVDFDIPKDDSPDNPIVITEIDSFYNEKIGQVGTYLIATAFALAEALGTKRRIYASALPGAVPFYIKLGFEIDWSQYEDLKTGKVPAKTMIKINRLFQSIMEGDRQISENLHLTLSPEKCALLREQAKSLDSFAKSISKS